MTFFFYQKGLYVCCAINLLASTCASAGLVVLSLSTPPLIYKAPLSQTLREDSIALIRCEIAIGTPGTILPINSLSASLQIQWLHNDSELNLSSQRYLQLESGTLQIHGEKFEFFVIFIINEKDKLAD